MSQSTAAGERRIRLHDGSEVPTRWIGPVSDTTPSGVLLVLAHGAGTDMHNPLVCAVQTGLAARGHVVVTFNFPYTSQGRRVPDRAPVLEACFEQVVEALRHDPSLSVRRIVLGGKSMGGRMATHLAARGVDVHGLLLLGYPLHPAGKRERLRLAHLPQIRVPSLFIAGTRDPLSDLELLRPALATIPAPVELHIIEGGDHSFGLPKKLARSTSDVYEEIITTTDAWLRRVITAR